MTHKIIILAIDALTVLASQKGHSGKFNYAVDDAIKSLQNVKKYL